MRTWQIRVEGIVQGVGFRPHVYSVAQSYRVNGSVSNGPEGVKIAFTTSSEVAEEFYKSILEHAPPNATITSHSLEETAPQLFENFRIEESQSCGTRTLLVTPDLGICMDCLKELRDPTNPRFGYPFITCTACGPRYSILTDLPYDRPYTTMEPFPMCKSCREEYQNPLDRRHFSQTNSCPECGVVLSLYYAELGSPWEGENEKILSHVHQYWDQGKIVAIKGIGGYLLTCDASNEQAIRTLRERKQRPTKPFALMFSDWGPLDLSPSERSLLESPSAPLLLVKKPEDLSLAPGIAEGLNEVGIMRPYAPLFEWLLAPYGKPIIATSANIHHSPIIYQDDEQDKLTLLADAVLSHNRKITLPQDDSVVRIAPLSQQRIVIRRSRGWAPSYVQNLSDLPKHSVWAAGADLKATMGFLHEGRVYVSQYLGDLSHADTESNYLGTRTSLEKLLQFRPKALVADLHPNYVSHHLARDWGEQLHISVDTVQHHKAHFTAILGEHNLFTKEEPILGIIWDGLGYGEDGNIWGGESFVYHRPFMKRMGHVKYFPSIAGDKMAREPRIAALCLLPKVKQAWEKFSSIEQQVYRKLLEKPSLKSSSMGRVFDAVASVLEIQDIQSYEGEAAMKLEALARNFLTQTGRFPTPYSGIQGRLTLPIQQLLATIHEDVKQGKEKEMLAAKFHITLADYVRSLADFLNLKHIACSGGVFQNAVLVDALVKCMTDRYQLYFHTAMSPNDENIAFGQLMYYTQKRSNQLLMT